AHLRRSEFSVAVRTEWGRHRFSEPTGTRDKERRVRSMLLCAAAAIPAIVVAGCQTAPPAPPAPAEVQALSSSEYIIGPGDSLNVFVWRKPDLSAKVPVRPDGRISIPLVEDVVAVGKTTTQLARELEERLKKYVQDPVVTVIAESFVGPFVRQVRVIGEAP